MSVYSFLDCLAAITGPGGSINLAAGAQVAEEGITVEPTEDKNIMTPSADGVGMHNLIASEFSTFTVRLLKTSPVNAMLQTMYNVQKQSSGSWGRNVVTIRDPYRGDNITLSKVAFKKRPTITNAKEGGTIEWQFDSLQTAQILGIGVPEI